MPKKRIKPRLSVTIDPDTNARLQRLVDQLPGVNTSGLVNEVLCLGLPMVEEMARVMRESIDDDGSLDEARARDALARWAGAQMLDFVSDIHGGMSGKEKRDLKAQKSRP